MSHTVRIVPQLLDVVAIRAAAARVGFREPEASEFLVGDRTVSSVQIHLPNSTASFVCDLGTGEAFGTPLNVEDQFYWNRFFQAYAIEKVRIEARRLGSAILEEPQADGSMRLTVLWRNHPCDDLS